ncbi:MAG: tRNA dihydrouridine(20/20a) synthase DusA [Gammaproteobacteria bacterium]|nr:tRNA dihydrouridine(20/20a) synthase DusA [Gammaproteobacteria bacterium]
MLDRRFSVAPMMDWTDKHDRYFLRLISPNVLLYTEMVTTGALIYGDRQRFLSFNPSEHPVALQLGGSDPAALALCAKMGQDQGYDEINLNVGCPSDRVKAGRFGACLMLEPKLVADCVAAMKSVVQIPVTIKCRIGIDEQDSYEELHRFISTIHAAGCDVFIIHARKAWLNGLSPKQNREIPPLRYDVVHQIKKDFPTITVILNGGLKTLEQIEQNMPFVDGVMIGREAYTNPYLLAEIEKKYYSTPESIATRYAVIEQFIPYLQEQLAQNVKLSSMTRHILGLFQGQFGAKLWRRYLSEHAHKSGAGIEVMLAALNYLDEEKAILSR